MTKLPRWIGLAGASLIAAALVAWTYWSQDARRAFVATMQAEGHRITAEVRSKRYEPALDAKPGGSYAITVKYTDHAGRRVLAENFVSEEFYDATNKGDLLPFWYLDGDTRVDRKWLLDPDFGLQSKTQVWALAAFLVAMGTYTYVAALRYDPKQAAQNREERRNRRAEIAEFKKRMAAKSRGEGPK